jgi:hypothetical protein
MSINRNAYLSLIESIQTAVSPLEETDSLWLSRQGKKTAGQAGVSKVAGKKVVSTPKNKPSKTVKPSSAPVSKAPAKVSKPSAALTARSSGGGAGGSGSKPVQWGDRSIGGAMNAMDLAKWLNSQSVPSLSEEEDFDLIDEILAEGIELYGEEGLAEILADFAETGEISDELAELLD